MRSVQDGPLETDPLAPSLPGCPRPIPPEEPPDEPEPMTREFWIEGTGGIHMDGERDCYEIRCNDEEGRLVRVARVLPGGRAQAERLVKVANLLIAPEPADRG